MFRLLQLVAAAAVLALAVGPTTADDKAAKKNKKGQPSLEARFKQMDLNGDDQVTKAEFTKHREAWLAKLKEKGKEPKGKANGDRLFQRLDTNGDGVLTQEEYVQAMKKAQEKRKKTTGQK
jgi:Ca2+-binding EF-hand superfamily protein